MHWFGNFIMGAKAVILKGIAPRWILDAISEEKITIVWLLVPWAMDLLLAIKMGMENMLKVGAIGVPGFDCEF